MNGGARVRVLVIDDNDLVRKVHTRCLRGNYDVVAVSSAGEALERLVAGERFAAILCDVEMPELDGVQFLRCVHGLDPEVAARVVFVTGGAPESLRRMLAGLPNSVISKPASGVVLLEAIRRIVES